MGRDDILAANKLAHDRIAALTLDNERLRLALGARNTEAELAWIEENERLREQLAAAELEGQHAIEMVGHCVRASGGKVVIPDAWVISPKGVLSEWHDPAVPRTILTWRILAASDDGPEETP